MLVVTPLRFQRIAILGSGALGSYYGTRLALAGADVRFLMRTDLAAVLERGALTIREKSGELRFAPVAAFGSSEEIGPVDLVLVTLKTTANAELPSLLPPLMGPDTVVVTLQNGLGNEEALAALVGADRVLGGLCFIAVTREAPGELRGYETPGSITLGEFGRLAGERAHALAAQFVHAGVKCTVVDDLRAARWRKLVWNVPFNGLTIAAGGVPTDRICADPALLMEVRALMAEIVMAAAAIGIDITDTFVRRQIEVTPPMGSYRPSSLVDYQAGRAVELEAIWGEPLRQARAAGVRTPRLELLYALLKALTKRT